MRSLSSYPISIRGSRKTLWRNVYQDEQGKYWIKFYGNIVEVIKASVGFYTVDYIDA